MQKSILLSILLRCFKRWHVLLISKFTFHRYATWSSYFRLCWNYKVNVLLVHSPATDAIPSFTRYLRYLKWVEIANTMAFSTVAPAFIIHAFNSFVLITSSLHANSLFHYYVEHFVDYLNFDPLVWWKKCFLILFINYHMCHRHNWFVEDYFFKEIWASREKEKHKRCYKSRRLTIIRQYCTF